jgi:hypothetical protein
VPPELAQVVHAVFEHDHAGLAVEHGAIQAVQDAARADPDAVGRDAAVDDVPARRQQAGVEALDVR